MLPFFQHILHETIVDYMHQFLQGIHSTRKLDGFGKLSEARRGFNGPKEELIRRTEWQKRMVQFEEIFSEQTQGIKYIHIFPRNEGTVIYHSPFFFSLYVYVYMYTAFQAVIGKYSPRISVEFHRTEGFSNRNRLPSDLTGWIPSTFLRFRFFHFTSFQTETWTTLRLTYPRISFGSFRNFLSKLFRDFLFLLLLHRYV